MRQYKRNTCQKQFKKYNNKNKQRFRKKHIVLYTLADQIEYHKRILPDYKPTYKLIERDNKKIYIPIKN